MLLYVNNGYANAHKFYVMRTLTFFLIRFADNVRCELRFYKQILLKEKLLLGKESGNINPITEWSGPEDSMRLSLPDFKTIGT